MNWHGSPSVWLPSQFPERFLPWLTGLTFIAFSIWALHPDSLDEDPEGRGAGAFGTTVMAFFLAEMGDKTQFATVALGARFEPPATVVLGTTISMLLAIIPTVLFGKRLEQRLALRAIRYVAAAVFIITGVGTIFRVPHAAR